MKKIIALLLAVMMVLAMAACAAKTTDTPAPAETDNKTDAVQETATEAAADGKTELNIGVLVWKYSDTYGSSVRVAMDKYAKVWSSTIITLMCCFLLFRQTEHQRKARDAPNLHFSACFFDTLT